MGATKDRSDHSASDSSQLIRELPPTSRRAFLKGGMTGIGLLTGVVVLGNVLEWVTVGDGKRLALARGVVLWERENCSGCRTCEAVCTNHNDLGRTSAHLARIIIEKDHRHGEYEGNTCFQCAEPMCLLACPVTALQVDRSSGTHARVIDDRVCIGCKQCIEACGALFRPPRPRYDSMRHVSVKCHLCFGDPQCVKFCPYGALRFERSEKGLQSGYPLIDEG